VIEEALGGEVAPIEVVLQDGDLLIAIHCSRHFWL